MPGSAAFAWMTRIKAVEREFNTARLAMARMRQQAMENPSVLAGTFEFNDMNAVLDRLEGTYLVRLFSEFETALRYYLRTNCGNQDGQKR